MRRCGRKLADARGFTFVELLVCMLVLGILAAIALPAWLDQRAKGEDAKAKVTIRTAAIALQAYEQENATYDATPAQLEAIEPSLGEAIDLRIDGDEDEYEIRETSEASTEFWMTRDPDGSISRDCSNHGYGLCRNAADDEGNHW